MSDLDVTRIRYGPFSGLSGVKASDTAVYPEASVPMRGGYNVEIVDGEVWVRRGSHFIGESVEPVYETTGYYDTSGNAATSVMDSRRVVYGSVPWQGVVATNNYYVLVSPWYALGIEVDEAQEGGDEVGVFPLYAPDTEELVTFAADGSTATSTSSTFIATLGQLMLLGSGNSATEEVYLVCGVSGSTITLDRNYEGSAGTKTVRFISSFKGAGVAGNPSLTAAGSSYTSAPTVKISGGVGATATATVNGSGVVTAVDVVTAGVGYTLPPAVSFSAASGSGATATAVITDGAVTAINVTGGGSGYPSSSLVEVSIARGSGATATASIAAGAVSAITLTRAGTGYTTAPTVEISGGGGAGATATATVDSGSLHWKPPGPLAEERATYALVDQAVDNASLGVVANKQYMVVTADGLSPVAFRTDGVASHPLIKDFLRDTIEDGSAVRNAKTVGLHRDSIWFGAAADPQGLWEDLTVWWSAQFDFTRYHTGGVGGASNYNTFSQPGAVDPVMGIQSFGPSVVIYRKYSQEIGTASEGLDTPYTFVSQAEGLGLTSPGAVVTANGVHYLSTQAGPAIFDGRVRPVGLGLRQHLEELGFWSRFRFLLHDPEEQMILFCCPDGTSVPQDVKEPVFNSPFRPGNTTSVSGSPRNSYVTPASMLTYNYSHDSWSLWVDAVVSGGGVTSPGNSWLCRADGTIAKIFASHYSSDPSVEYGKGELISVKVTDPGSGYSSASVGFSGGGGTLAEASATLAGGKVGAITLTNPGKDYTSSPTVSITGSGGSGATAEIDYPPTPVDALVEFPWTDLGSPGEKSVIKVVVGLRATSVATPYPNRPSYISFGMLAREVKEYFTSFFKGSFEGGLPTAGGTGNGIHWGTFEAMTDYRTDALSADASADLTCTAAEMQALRLDENLQLPVMEFEISGIRATGHAFKFRLKNALSAAAKSSGHRKGPFRLSHFDVYFTQKGGNRRRRPL